MNAEESESFIKKALKRICSTNGWSYGVFWGFDHTNSLLLTMQDAYCEEELGGVIDDMFLQVHMLGGGIIGQVAFTKKHRWMFSDCHYDGCEVSQDDSEFYHQFASGIKTIAVIPIEPHGALQFGSTNKIKEVTEFVNQTKRVFCERTNCNELILPENSLPSLNFECDGSSGLFASLISSGDTKFSGRKFQQGADWPDLIGTTCSPVIPIQSLSFVDHRKENSLLNELSRRNTYFHASGAQSLAMVSSDLNTEFQQTPYNIAWRCGDTPLTSINHQPSELRSHASDNLLPFTPNRVVSFGNAVQYFQNPTSISSGSYPLSSEILVNQLDSTLQLDSIKSGSIFEEYLEAANYSKDHCMLNRIDGFNQWFSPLPQSNETDLIPLNDDFLSHVTGLVAGPYNFNGSESPMIFSSMYPANSVQSSVTSTSQSNGQEKCSSFIKVEHDPFNDLGCIPAGNRDDILLPTKTTGHVNSNHDTSECISEQRVSSSFGHPKRLFSELGIKQLIEDLSGASSSDRRPSSEDHLSSTYKKMKTEISLGISDPVQIAGQPCFGKKFIQQQKEDGPKLESGSWVSDNCEVNTGHSGLQHKKNDSTAKPMKKKAKPGARPRPKDRQLIQDRLSELRELIPKGEKMSIDCLLDRTIKYILFLQSVTKHAHALKQFNDTKDHEIVQKDYSSSRGGGVTWACEFSDQSMVCPLLVEDLRYPGQMLIEMLCEEQGFFLEIVDSVRGFGLTILKGMMKVRKSKIWARFTVESEGNKHVTRQDIFSTLVQLLQLTAPNRVDVREQRGNVNDGETTGVNLYKQPVGPPDSLAETLHHASV